MKSLPYEFVFEELASAGPETKAMFGAHGLYIDGKIVLILRQRDASPADNGVWIATTSAHHASLKADFPSMRSIGLFGPGPTGWQILPEDAEDFEESALRICQLVLARDPRIGKDPSRKRALRTKAKLKVKSKPMVKSIQKAKAKIKAKVKAKPPKRRIKQQGKKK